MTAAKLVVCDIDGTLVTPGLHDLPEDAAPTVQALMNSGIAFALCSGRQYAMAEPILQRLPAGVWLITQNGSALYRGGKLLWTNPLDRALALDTARQMQNRGKEVLLSTADGYFLPDGAPRTDEMRHIYRTQPIHPITAPEEVPGDILQVTLFDFEDIRRHEQPMRRFLAGRASCAVASDYCLDVNAGSKGIGVQTLCRLLKLSPAQAICFGDSDNDRSMFDVCGTAYIMETAAPALLARYPLHTVSPLHVMRNLLL